MAASGGFFTELNRSDQTLSTGNWLYFCCIHQMSALVVTFKIIKLNKIKSAVLLIDTLNNFELYNKLCQ